MSPGNWSLGYYGGCRWARRRLMRLINLRKFTSVISVIRTSIVVGVDEICT